MMMMAEMVKRVRFGQPQRNNEQGNAVARTELPPCGPICSSAVVVNNCRRTYWNQKEVSLSSTEVREKRIGPQ